MYFPLCSGVRFFRLRVHLFFFPSSPSSSASGRLSFSHTMSGRGYPLAVHFRRTELPTGRAMTRFLIFDGCVKRGRTASGDVRIQLQSERLKQSVSPLAAGAGQEINNTEINNFPPLGELQMETRRGGREKSEQKKLLAEINGLQSSFIFTSSVQLCRPVETERTGTDHGIHQRVLNVTFIRSTERSKPRYLQRLRDRRRAQRCLKPREPVSIRDVTIFTIRQIKTDLGFRRHVVLIDL